MEQMICHIAGGFVTEAELPSQPVSPQPGCRDPAHLPQQPGWHEEKNIARDNIQLRIHTPPHSALSPPSASKQHPEPVPEVPVDEEGQDGLWGAMPLTLQATQKDKITATLCDEYKGF